MKFSFEKIISIPKSLYVSFRLFPFQNAWRMPILVRYNCKLQSLHGIININGGVKTAILQIGFGHVGVFDKTYERSIIEINGRIELKGETHFGHGSRICVTRNGILRIGKHFSNTAMMTIICDEKIEIGDDVTVSWNTLVMDTDWHTTLNTLTNETRPHKGAIRIDNKVWLCTRCVILKGSSIAEGCIIGANAVICGRFSTPHSLIAGNPATERKHNITMNRDQKKP